MIRWRPVIRRTAAGKTVGGNAAVSEPRSCACGPWTGSDSDPPDDREPIDAVWNLAAGGDINRNMS